MPACSQVLYRLEVPDSICLFALFYAFPPETIQKERDLVPATGSAPAGAVAAPEAKRVFSSLLAPPPWARNPLQRLKVPLGEALPRLAALKSHVLQHEPAGSAARLQEGGLEAQC